MKIIKLQINKIVYTKNKLQINQIVYIKKKYINNNRDKNNLIVDNNKKESNPPIKRSKTQKKKIRKINTIITSGDKSNKSSKIYDNSQFQIKSKTNLQNSIFNNNLNQKDGEIKLDGSIIKFNDYELNTLSYEEAIKYDKRNYTQFYLSLLKTKHILIFSFCSSNDYNSRIIKIYSFFYSFAIYCNVNALFFSDSTIHQIHEDGGSFNFIYQIPQIIYSSLISSILSVLLKYLSLSEKSLLSIKRGDMNSLDEKVPEILKCLYYKFIIFFSSSFILLLFFWYYLSNICTIYQNAQFHLFKNSIISF